MFTLSGIPVLYSGDEIAQENDYSYHNDPLKSADSRYLHRGKMNWPSAEKRSLPGTPEGRIFSALRRLETLREEHRVFDGQADVWLTETGDNAVLGIGRYRDGEKLLAFFNFADSPRTVQSLEDGVFVDLYAAGPGVRAETVDLSEITLEPGGFRWLLCDFDKL